MRDELNKIFAKVDDSTDVWKVLREYILTRIKNRYDTLDEMQDDVNDKYGEVMTQIQGHYDNWFNAELLKNYALYNIEIMGGDDIINEHDMDIVDEEGLDDDTIDENENPNEDIDLSDDDEKHF